MQPVKLSQSRQYYLQKKKGDSGQTPREDDQGRESGARSRQSARSDREAGSQEREEEQMPAE